MLNFINKYIFGTAVPVMLVLAGIFYMFYLRVFHIRKFGTVIKSMTNKQEKGGTSPFRALTLALAGTLGVGNIVGVSSAIYLGGFGSVFWMWVSAFCAMLLKYAEIVLAMRHRRFDDDGRPHGSAMLYIKDFFSSIGLTGLGKTTAAIFALLCIINSISMGSMIQASAVTNAFEGSFGIPTWLCGAVLSILTLFVITKGTDGISRFTEKLVPFMTLGYIILSLAVLILRADQLSGAFSSIFKSAFSSESAFGGVVGFLLSSSLRFGTMRGLLSNEAGCGTAPAAHAISNAKYAAEQGFWGIFEVFADTIVLCTLTALVVIISYPSVAHYKDDSIMMTLSAYTEVLGNFAGYFLVVAVLFFAFATVVCWAHYGMESVLYLSNKKETAKAFAAVYSLSVFFGGILKTELIWNCADFAIGAMTLINIVIIVLMRKEVKEETEIFFTNKKG